MPRIIVSADPVGAKRNRYVLFDEEVKPDHLDDEHSSVQLLERMEWALRGCPPKLRAVQDYRSVDRA